MTTSYPGAIDSFTNPASGDLLSTGHASQHDNANDAVKAIETLLGPKFTPESYGAKGDGVQHVDGAITTGTAAFTSTSGTFTSADVGKTILVNGAGTSGGPLVTTISAYTDATAVTLTANASTTVTAASYTYGTDDTSAIQSAINAAVTYAQANGFYAEVWFRPVTYIVAAALTQAGTNLVNAQIALPLVPISSGAYPKVTLVLRGAVSAAGFPNGFQLAGPRNGAVLFSTLTGQAYNGSYGQPSVVGSWTPEQGAGNGGSGANFSNMLLVVRGMSIVVPRNPTLAAWDLGGVCEVDGDGWSALADFTLKAGTPVRGTNSSWGLRMPLTTNNDLCRAGRFTASGFYYGALIAEHSHFDELAAVWCTYGMVMNGGGHAARIEFLSSEVNTYDIGYVAGAGTSSVTHPTLYIGQVASEGVGTYNVDDGSNNLYGQILYANIDGSFHSAAPSVNGGHNLRIIAQGQAPGAVTAPGVPATTVAYQNVFWRDAAVSVAGGTVTAIAVDGTATGLTSGTVFVPAGKTITLTYSAAPTWVWVLL